MVSFDRRNMSNDLENLFPNLDQNNHRITSEETPPLQLRRVGGQRLEDIEHDDLNSLADDSDDGYGHPLVFLRRARTGTEY